MIIDASALIAIVSRESGFEALVSAIDSADELTIGAPTLVESGIVLTAKAGPIGKTMVARFLQETEAEVTPFAPEHWPVAVDAFRRFGKGNHKAALNFGDCMTYALAAVSQQSLLCTGADFAKTDVALALEPG